MTEEPAARTLDPRLAVVQGILDSAFFIPLYKNDWLAYRLGQPALLRLEDSEAFDLFVRTALVCEVLHPQAAEGRDPLAWVASLEEPAPVLAQVLASLRRDRPFLFHRVFLSLEAVRRGELDPKDFELVEDLLAQALAAEEMDLAEAAAEELATVCRRALQAAGLDDPQSPPPRLEELAAAVLAREEAVEMDSEYGLRLWLALGEGLEDVPAEDRPAVMALAWRRWVQAVIGRPPDLELLARLVPQMALSASELALFAPPSLESEQVITAECPFCHSRCALALGQQVRPRQTCAHLVYIGTSDEAHLLQVLGHFDLGDDFRKLLTSYYQSPTDLDLFSTIVNDLFELLVGEGRLAAVPVSGEGSPKGFYYLLAFFRARSPEEAEDRSQDQTTH